MYGKVDKHRNAKTAEITKKKWQMLNQRSQSILDMFRSIIIS